MPEDKLDFPAFLMNLDCFDVSTLTKEDLKRTEYYKDETARSASNDSFQSLESWLETINIKIHAEPLNKNNIQRVAQLFNKTNQMNLGTRRLTERELLDFAEVKSNSIWAFSVSDKFGDAGLTGIIGMTFESEKAILTDFILSCRVMGRKCEETMLGFAVQLARERKCKTLIAEHEATEKNRPCLDFFKRSGMKESENTFTWDCMIEYVIPQYISLTHAV
jgi:FkbH-like protein